MTLAAWYSINQGRSLSFDGDPANTGQCVQSVAFYCRDALGLPVMYKNASEWWYGFSLPGSYDRIANTATAVPQAGDIIIWDRSLPNSGGFGHIAICWEPRPGTGTFVSVDSNWGGKTVHLVTHNYSYVIGWLRPKTAAAAPPPAAAQQQVQGDEMITTPDQATKIYRMLRPNGTPSPDEINGTVNRRSFAQFINDAQNEVNQRDAALRSQVDQLTNLSNTINQLNQAITDTKVNDGKSFADYQAKIADLTAQLTTTHDQLAELQAKIAEVPEVATPPEPAPQLPENAGLLAKLLAIIFKPKS